MCYLIFNLLYEQRFPCRISKDSYNFNNLTLFGKNYMDKSTKRKRAIGDVDEKNKLMKANRTSTDIDLVLDHEVLGNKLFYFVKWKNCGRIHNSWVSEENILGSDDLIQYYQFLIQLPDSLNEKIVAHFIDDLVTRTPLDILSLTRLCALIYSCTEEIINDLKLSFTELQTKAMKVKNIPVKKLNKKRRSLWLLMRFTEARKLVLSNNMEWEREINKVSPVYIRVENNVDLDEAPYTYQFIQDYESTYVDLTENPVVFCSCDNCFENCETCCSQRFDAHFAYNNLQRIQIPPGYEIHECNRLCKCGPDCINRVVQHGQKIRMAIFKTSNGCGWGLKTLETIPKGQFVLEYFGEVITTTDAEIRDQAYDVTGTTYLFDLDFGKECSFTVDASQKGNASRFINHSCDPNLQVYTVWINQHDPNLPRLAFFTRRRIECGDELTFDYKMADNKSELVKEETKRVLCKCNSKNCKKYLF